MTSRAISVAIRPPGRRVSGYRGTCRRREPPVVTALDAAPVRFAAADLDPVAHAAPRTPSGTHMKTGSVSTGRPAAGLA